LQIKNNFPDYNENDLGETGSAPRESTGEATGEATGDIASGLPIDAPGMVTGEIAGEGNRVYDCDFTVDNPSNSQPRIRSAMPGPDDKRRSCSAGKITL
jgi:hypothetical protein